MHASTRRAFGSTGSPTRSLYQYELLIRLCKMFHLAQDFYWFNPSRLPTPAEWVTIKRTRVKDAVNPIWWLSKSEHPQADNRQVLRPYSKSMKRLLRDGYDVAMRPSQHEIRKQRQALLLCREHMRRRPLTDDEFQPTKGSELRHGWAPTARKAAQRCWGNAVTSRGNGTDAEE